MFQPLNKFLTPTSNKERKILKLINNKRDKEGPKIYTVLLQNAE